jgi:protocatechuate 3,4-dioxygenase beta subunit
VTHVSRFPSGLLLVVPLLFVAGKAAAGELRGRLFTGDAPAPGVTVSAVPYETPADAARREARGGEEAKPVGSAATGAAGSFVLVLPEGGKSVVLRASGGGIRAVLFDGVYDAGESADLGEKGLARGEAIAGTVVDGSGAPVPGAEVTLRAPTPGDADLLPAPIRTWTGADGTFRFDGAAPAGNTLSFAKKGFAPLVNTSARAGALAKPVVLVPGVPLPGFVKPLPGKSAAGTLVRFDGRAETRWVEAAEDGSFTIPDVPAGKGTLVADAGDAGWGELGGVVVPLQEGRKVVVALVAPAALEGRVVDARTLRPVPRARVDARDGVFVRTTRSGSDGRYRLGGLPPRTFRVSADEPRYVPFVKSDVAVASRETRKLDAPLSLAASISGRVTDESGAPVAGARGALARGGESNFRALLRQVRGSGAGAFRTSADGTFRAVRLMPGDNQRLTVGHADFTPTTLAGVSLVSGQTTANVSVVLRRGAVIAGVLRDPNGEPVVDAEIEVSTAFGFRGGRGGMPFQIGLAGGPGGPNAKRTKSGSDGRFALKGLTPGDYTVVVRKPGLATERLDPVKVPEEGSPEPLSVTLVPGAAIGGVVRTRNGNPGEGWMVTAAKGGSSPIGPRAQGGGTPTGPDGAFFLDGLKAGEAYDLTLLGGTGMSPGRRGVVAPSGDVEILVAGTGRIPGRALDAASGQPLTEFQVGYEPDRSGAGAVLRFASRASGRRMTGIGESTPVRSEDGTFLLEDVPAGTWAVFVTAKDYQPARAGSVVVEDGGAAKDVEVKVSRGAALKGHVTDAATGRPVPNAAISHENERAAGGPMIFADAGDSEIVTDADGRFEIGGLGVGRIRLTAKHPDYADASDTVEVKESGTALELKLTAGGALAGAVISDTGQPLPGTDVALAAAGDAGFGRGMAGGQSTSTDASGRFRFDHLGAGRYSLTAQLRTRSSAPLTVVLQAGQSNETLSLAIAAGSTVQGTVSGIPDSWKNGMTVTANGPDGFFASTRTGPDGRFQFMGVPAGAVSLRATAGDFAGSSRSVMKQVTVDDSQPVLETELVFEPGFSLSGRVTRAGAPIVNATVVANLEGGGGRQAATHTDDGGAYRMDGLTGGTYQVGTMSSLFGGASRRDTVTVAGDQTLDIVFPAAKLGGTVLDAAGRQPLPDAVVEVTAADAAANPFVRSVTTDSNGTFLLADIEPKSYTVNVRKAGYQYSKREITAAEQGTDALTFELTRGDGIGVVGRDGLYGVPLRGLLVRVSDSQQAVVFQGSISLDADGKGEIPSLRPGSYTLMADASGYAAVTVPNVSVPSSPVTVSLTPGGGLEIRSGPKTLAAGTARVHLRTVAGAPVPLSLFNPTGDVAISTPVRRLDNIAPGSYVLTVEGGSASPFSIQEGGLAVLNLP